MTNENTTQEGQTTTPRTDHSAFVVKAREVISPVVDWEVVHVGLARRLERELAAHAETIAKLTEAYHAKTKQADELRLDLVRALAQLTEARRDGERLEYTFTTNRFFANRQAIDTAQRRDAGEGK